MQINITVNMDNAAFKDNPRELREILKKIAKEIERGWTLGKARDMNGNAAVRWEINDDR